MERISSRRNQRTEDKPTTLEFYGQYQHFTISSENYDHTLCLLHFSTRKTPYFDAREDHTTHPPTKTRRMRLSAGWGEHDYIL